MIAATAIASRPRAAAPKQGAPPAVDPGVDARVPYHDAKERFLERFPELWAERAAELAPDDLETCILVGDLSYKAKQTAQARGHYRRCLEDATGPRRAAYLYDLGNAILMQSKGAEPKLIRQAIDCFALCLRQPEAADDVHKNAAHNLELAKVLYAKARQARAGKDPGSNDPDEPKDNKPPEPKKEEPKTQSGDPTVGPNGTPMPKGKQEPVDPRDPMQPIPVDAPPPPGTVTIMPGKAPAGGRNCKAERAKAKQMAEGTACYGCHQLMDPIGFGLDNYDDAGVFRPYETNEKDENITSCPASGDGVVPAIGEVQGGPFNGPAGLANLLLQDDVLDSCAATQLFRFGMGRLEF